MKQWYVIYTKPREDARAQQHLANQGYDTFRPMLKHHVLTKGGQKTIVESLFPRYVFIELDQEASNWSRLRSTRGVSSLVSFNQRPAVVDESFVTQLKHQLNDDCVLDQTKEQPRLFNAGDAVDICSGSFGGLQAIVKAQTSEERVVVLLNMLGSQQTISVPIKDLVPH